MIKKRLLTAAVILVFAAMAMGSTSDSGTSKEIVESSESKNDDDADASNEESSQSEENDPAEADSSTEDDSSSANFSNITIEEQVLVDQDGVVITAKEFVADDIWGDGIKLLIENNSSQNLMIGCNALIVNNYMLTDFFAEEVAAGKKLNSTVYLSSSELKAAEIDNIGQVEIYFHIYDDDTYDDVANPYALIKTSEYENMDIKSKDLGMELYNKNGIRIVGNAVNEDTFWGTAVLLYLENNSGNNVGFSVDNLSINGFMMSPYFSCSVFDQKMALDDITILSSDLEENGIESVDDVELAFHIYDLDTYDTIDDTDPISFSTK